MFTAAKRRDRPADRILIAILSKPSDEITAADVQALVDTSSQENDRLEFKAALPASKGTPDPWTAGKSHIGEYAKTQLLREAIAFANAYGGALVLGISEDSNGIANGSHPVPRCKELADRLRLVFRDCVEPQLPHVEVFGIETSGTDGFVIIRVGKSRLAPHRSTRTLECTIRRADRCEPMAMREIQDMTLNVSRGLQRMDDELSHRSQLFSREFRCLQTPDEAYGLRFTAIPVADDVWTGKLLADHNLSQRFRPPPVRVHRKTAGQDRPQILQGVGEILGARHGIWVPRLRAARSEHRIRSWFAGDVINCISYRELHFNGMIELGLLSVHSETDDHGKQHSYRLHYEVPAVEFATLVAWAHHVRVESGAPTAEYVVDVQIKTTGTCELVNTAAFLGQPFGSLDTGSTLFPRYSFGDQSEIPTLLNAFEQDFLNAFGQDLTNQLGSLTMEERGQQP